MFKAQQWHLISFIGQDANKFLQGQIPVNLETLEDNHSTFSCLSVHSGKVIATYRLLKIDNQKIYFLVFGQEQVDKILTHLKKFAIFSKVKIEQDASATISFVPSTNREVGLLNTTDGEIRDNFLPNIQLIINFNQTNTFETINSLQVVELATTYGYVYNLRSELVDQYLPQAFAIDSLEQAISFKKGCYQGQEGIARAKYRGTNPYLFQQFIVDPSVLNELNSYKLVALLDDKQKPTGTIIDAAVIGELATNYCSEFKGQAVLSAIISKKLAANEYTYALAKENELVNMIPLLSAAQTNVK